MSAFFTCLRANLVLSPRVLSSNYSTPFLEPTSTAPLQPPAGGVSTSSSSSSSSPCITPEPLVPLDDIPSLSLDVLESEHDKAEGLRLVAASVSEMRPRATNSVILHPLCLAAVAAAWAAIYRLVYVTDTEKDAGRALMLASGLTMLYVATVRFFASGYSALAERLSRDWLGSGGEEDIMLGARVGDTIVGALVLRLESHKNRVASPKRKGRGQGAILKGGKGVIRSWTTSTAHRGQGIGKKLLNEAVRYTKDRCGKDAAVGFAQEHANSVMLLPDLFNKTFRRDEVQAARALEAVNAAWDQRKRKNSVSKRLR